jgi:hypothetical protein
MRPLYRPSAGARAEVGQQIDFGLAALAAMDSNQLRGRLRLHPTAIAIH